jgi:hypothetical protein
MDTKNENLSPRAGRPKWPILTMIAIAAGIIFSQWLGSVWRGPQTVEPQPEAVEPVDPSTP